MLLTTWRELMPTAQDISFYRVRRQAKPAMVKRSHDRAVGHDDGLLASTKGNEDARGIYLPFRLGALRLNDEQRVEHEMIDLDAF